MSYAKKLHTYLLTKRELDLETLKSYIQVEMETSDYVQELADVIGIDAVDCLDALETLDGTGKIRITPQIEGYIDHIEVYDR